MRRYAWWYGAGTAVLAMLVLWPLAAAAVWERTGETVAEPTTITDYRAEFTVGADGWMDVTETITVDFPREGSHGIFRFFDSADPNAPKLRREPVLQDVTVDPDTTEAQRLELARSSFSEGYFDEEILPGLVEEYGEAEGRRRALDYYGDPYSETSTSKAGWADRFTNIRIGSESDEVAVGEHVYVITYKMSSVLLADGDGSRFYWNLVPSGWRQPIERADLTVHLPAEADGVRCAVGSGRGSGCASVEGEGTGTVHVTARDLAPGTPVTLRTGMDLAAPSTELAELPWSQSWDPVMGSDTGILGVLIGLVVAAMIPAGYILARTWDPLPRADARATPPAGVGPAQAAYLVSKTVRPRQLAASLLYAASRGALAIRSTQNGWKVSLDNPRSSWDDIDGVSAVVRELGGVAIGAKKSTAAAQSAGRRMYRIRNTYGKKVRAWALDEGLLEQRTSRVGWIVAFVVCALAAVVLAVVRPGGTTLWALVPGVFAVLIGPVLAAGSGLVRTRAGRELAAEVIGFRSTLGSRKGDFVGDQATYDSFLPWAVALGCAKDWARKLEVKGSAPAAPSYLPYDQHPRYRNMTVVGTAGLVSEITHDFESSIDSAVRSYSVSSSGGSSSGGGSSYSGGGGGGGGGSFGGGGGGGDGGGGSW
ncbi:DUF2207 domain-containing protein [Nocardioides sp.]|uniref:DUF2207 domain-containing protein n=1 Tax=Nocardioides sp. TaxID=35761 RepID=UPI00199BE651|nr:DUF2207 domain-containing protein [Nocardioides sp.]MBC7276627.1 DUF2207 domain-containing protein [Nocardioides sp.]